jgi:hypothetical protein
MESKKEQKRHYAGACIQLNPEQDCKENTDFCLD